jgi:hypothetical protein
MIAPDVGKKVSQHMKEGPRQHKVFEDSCFIFVGFLWINFNYILFVWQNFLNFAFKVQYYYDVPHFKV